jgi:prepilin-type N-terminal cleavage/methylation domain-containing protein
MRIRGQGFTLIELLIVVAIIAILAAIAVPNFLEAQVRSKVARVKNDMRSLRTGLEAYRVDHNIYAPDWGYSEAHTWAQLTTPIAYMTSILGNPFPANNMTYQDTIDRSVYAYGSLHFPIGGEFVYLPYDSYVAIGMHYWIISAGPDLYTSMQDASWGNIGDFWIRLDSMTDHLEYIYNPTNGARSGGDLISTSKGAFD